MLTVKKFVIGIRPATQVFRVQSLWGEIADAVLASARSNKKLGRTYFDNVRTTDNRDSLTLTSKDASISLTVNTGNVVFSKHTYHGDKLSHTLALDEFNILWDSVDRILKVDAIRRVGMVGECRLYDIDEPSRMLSDRLLKLEGLEHPAKVNFRLENRLTANSDGRRLDVKTDAFDNVIYSFYDASLDVDVPEDTAINLNFDYQRYYEPSLSRGVTQEVGHHYARYKERFRDFESMVQRLGFLP